MVHANFSVAVVGKDVNSKTDDMLKQSPELSGCRNLVRRLSLDQTYFTIAKAGLSVSCRNGLSVLAGATDTQIIVLDMSIDWSKRAIYRNENPFYKIQYVKGRCPVYCGLSFRCAEPATHGEFACIPDYDTVRASVFSRLSSPRAQ